jgi:hypothetical protein
MPAAATSQRLLLLLIVRFHGIDCEELVFNQRKSVGEV